MKRSVSVVPPWIVPGLLLAILLVTVAAATVVVQPNLVPISPADATSSQHQVRQDDAILAIATQHGSLEQRVTRLERIGDGIIIGLVAICATVVWSGVKTRGRVAGVHDQLNSRLDELLAAARIVGRAQAREEFDRDHAIAVSAKVMP